MCMQCTGYGRQICRTTVYESTRTRHMQHAACTSWPLMLTACRSVFLVCVVRLAHTQQLVPEHFRQVEVLSKWSLLQFSDLHAVCSSWLHAHKNRVTEQRARCKTQGTAAP
eukprot:scpid50266/ scgid18297/ 